MDHAVQNAFDYVGRHTDCPDKKLSWRIKGVIKRRARQQSAKKSREIQFGSLLDLKKCMLVNQRQSKESMRTNRSRGFAVCPIDSGAAMAGILVEEDRCVL
jgi:hypothetical protein